jgi:hypothetical protein
MGRIFGTKKRRFTMAVHRRRAPAARAAATVCCVAALSCVCAVRAAVAPFTDTTACAPASAVHSYAMGDAIPLCFTLNGVNKVMFTPRVDIFSAATLTGCECSIACARPRVVAVVFAAFRGRTRNDARGCRCCCMSGGGRATH